MGIMKASIKFYRVCHTQKAKKKKSGFSRRETIHKLLEKNVGAYFKSPIEVKASNSKKNKNKI